MIFEVSGLVGVGREDHERFLGEFHAEYPDNLEFNIYGELGIREGNGTLASNRLGVTLLPGKGEVGIHTVLKRSGIDLQSVASDIERIQRFYDAMAFAGRGRSILVEPRLRSAKVGVRASVDQALLDATTDMVLAIEAFPATRRKPVERVLAWYRDSFRVRSPVNHFSMLWNALEILVLGWDESDRTRGERLSAAKAFLQERGDSLTLKDLNDLCFTMLQQSIPSRMRRGFEQILGADAAAQIEICFERQPTNTRLWEVRNDINHGNIVERDPVQVARVIEAAIDLHSVVRKTVTKVFA